MWNPKQELVKKSVELAHQKYPNGFDKRQLIECSQEVYGGFAASPFKAIETMEDVHNMGNYFSEIDGHYPRGMSGCYVVGLSGRCGANTCPVFKSGECKVEDPKQFVDEIQEMIDNDEFSESDLITLLCNYPKVDEFTDVAEYFYSRNNQK